MKYCFKYYERYFLNSDFNDIFEFSLKQRYNYITEYCKKEQYKK